jgi:hypothetical protein
MGQERSSNGSADGFPPILTFSATYFDTYNQHLNYDYTLRPTMLLQWRCGTNSATARLELQPRFLLVS